MTGDDGGDDYGMRKRRLKTEVVTITNLDHAVGIANA